MNNKEILSPEEQFKEDDRRLFESFRKDLESLINRYSIENICDIPDFLLAEIIVEMIVGIGPKIKRLLSWHGCNSVCHPKKSDESEQPDN